MKKYLVLPILMFSFNVFASNVEDMTKAEVMEKHVELYEAVKAGATEATCKAFRLFDKESTKLKKIELLDFDANDRASEVETECRNKGIWKK